MYQFTSILPVSILFMVSIKFLEFYVQVQLVYDFSLVLVVDKRGTLKKFEKKTREKLE